MNRNLKMKSIDRCKNYRKKILQVSQQVSALHIGGAFSCIEIVDCIYNELMSSIEQGDDKDTFILSKGHGCMSQYVVLESLGILTSHDLENFSKSSGILGVHPDLGNPGIEASTGALGHGLGIAVGIAQANKILKKKSKVYVVMSDGEVQEGSVWEAALMASSLNLGNLIAFVDYNKMMSIGAISTYHPSFYPLKEKFLLFGWDAYEINGHDESEIINVINNRNTTKPCMIIANTIKGKGVSFMENNPLWHYRTPSEAEYNKAMGELSNEK
jgi:transketolase